MRLLVALREIASYRALSQGPTARDLRAAARTGYGTKYLEAVTTLEKDTDTLPVRFDAPTWPRY